MPVDRPEAPILFSSFLYSVHLLVILIGLIIHNIEELKLVDTLGGGDDTEPVAELHLLEELLGPVVPKLSAILDCGKYTGEGRASSYRYFR